MGIYCCCGAKISANDKCKCNNKGWITINSSEDLPKKDGTYLTRFIDNGGDKHEMPQKFTVIARIQHNYFNNPVNIHWEKQSWDDYIVTQWKYL